MILIIHDVHLRNNKNQENLMLASKFNVLVKIMYKMRVRLDETFV